MDVLLLNVLLRTLSCPPSPGAAAAAAAVAASLIPDHDPDLDDYDEQMTRSSDPGGKAPVYGKIYVGQTKAISGLTFDQMTAK